MSDYGNPKPQAKGMTATFPVFAKQNTGVARKGNSTTEDAQRIFGVLIHDVAGSTMRSFVCPDRGSQKERHGFSVSFFLCLCPQDTTSFDRLRSTSFSRRLTSLYACGHKTMLRYIANDVTATAVSDVGLRPTMFSYVETKIYNALH